MAGVSLTRGAVRRISRAVRSVEASQPNALRDIATGQRLTPGAVLVLEGLLDADLGMPVTITDPAPPTAPLSVYRWNESRTTFLETGLTVTVTNRAPETSALALDYLMVAWVNGEWRPIEGLADHSGSRVVSVATALYTTQEGDRLILVDTAIMSAGASVLITVSPPTITNEGTAMTIKNVGISTSNAVIVGPMRDTVGSTGVFSAALYSGEYAEMVAGFGLTDWWAT